MKKPLRFSIWFFAGMLGAVGLVVVFRSSPKQAKEIHSWIGVCVAVLTLALLPFFILRGIKEAVPAKKTDVIGYGVILVAILAVAGIGYVFIR